MAARPRARARAPEQPRLRLPPVASATRVAGRRVPVGPPRAMWLLGWWQVLLWVPAPPARGLQGECSGGCAGGRGAPRAGQGRAGPAARASPPCPGRLLGRPALGSAEERGWGGGGDPGTPRPPRRAGPRWAPTEAPAVAVGPVITAQSPRAARTRRPGPGAASLRPRAAPSRRPRAPAPQPLRRVRGRRRRARRAPHPLSLHQGSAASLQSRALLCTLRKEPVSHEGHSCTDRQTDRQTDRPGEGARETRRGVPSGAPQAAGPPPSSQRLPAFTVGPLSPAPVATARAPAPGRRRLRWTSRFILSLSSPALPWVARLPSGFLRVGMRGE